MVPPEDSLVGSKEEWDLFRLVLKGNVADERVMHGRACCQFLVDIRKLVQRRRSVCMKG